MQIVSRARRDAATLPIRIIDKSLVSDGVIIDTVVNKYCTTVRFFGKRGLLRDAGIDISRLRLRLGDDHRRDVNAGCRSDAQPVVGRTYIQRMKLRSMFRPMTEAAPIIRRISGSTDAGGMAFLISA